MRTKILLSVLLIWISAFNCLASELYDSSVIVSDVQTRSFIVSWSATSNSNSILNIYLDPKGKNLVNSVVKTPQFIYATDEKLNQVMLERGLFRTRVHGLEPNTHYYFQIEQDKLNGTSRLLPSTGPLFHVKTMDRENIVLNDTLAAYIQRQSEQSTKGELIYFSFHGAAYPLSHVVGDSLPENMAAISLSNVGSSEKHLSLKMPKVEIGKRISHGLSEFTFTLPENSNLGRLQIVPEIITLETSKDTDLDGIPDWYEIKNGLNVNQNDSLLDADLDGLTNIEEFRLGTSSNLADTDQDGIDDYQEIKIAGTSALTSDTDNDGLSDYQELKVYKTDALSTDSDGDTFSDADEVRNGYDPKDSQVHPPFADKDNDGIADKNDNCPALSNPKQEDTDLDGIGNSCDEDDDNDGVEDHKDNAPLIPNTEQTDTDNDLIGDIADNCPFISNIKQEDNDGDGLGDLCDEDDDNDTVSDYKQEGEVSDTAALLNDITSVRNLNLEYATNSKAKVLFFKQTLDLKEQILLGEFDLFLHKFKKYQLTHENFVKVGQLITVIDAESCNCVIINQPKSQLQVETNNETINMRLPTHIPKNGRTLFLTSEDGSAFKQYSSLERTRLINLLQSGKAFKKNDNCQYVPNLNQLDIDLDGIGDACDITPQDLDGDGILNASDNCPAVHNENQNNIDGDAYGDACDEDIDGDGLTNDVEINELFTDPNNAFSWSASTSDGDADFDNDGFSNSHESKEGTPIFIPNIRLGKGRNLIYYPTFLLDKPTASGLIEALGGKEYISRLTIFNNSGEIAKEYYLDGEEWAGENFDLLKNQAVQIEAINAKSVITSNENNCETIKLEFGKNYTSLPCRVTNISSFKILKKYGPEKIKSITAIDPSTGLFQTAAFFDGVITGDDFLIQSTAGYIIDAMTDFNIDPPPSSENGILIKNQDELNIVSDSELFLNGSIDTQTGVLMINGHAVPINGGLFNSGKITLLEGDNLISIRGRDSNGRSISHDLVIKYVIPPEFEIISHENNDRLFSKSITVAGTFERAHSVYVNGVQSILKDGMFMAYPVELKMGINKLRVKALGEHGVTTEKIIEIHTEPQNITLFADDAIDVDFHSSWSFGPTVYFSNPKYIKYLSNNEPFEASVWFDRFPDLEQVGFKAEFKHRLRGDDYQGQRFEFSALSTNLEFGNHQFAIPIKVYNKKGDSSFLEESWLSIDLLKENGGGSLVITSHEDGQVVSQPDHKIQGYLIEAESLTLNGQPIDTVAGYFDFPITLKSGRNYLNFEITRKDSDNNITTSSEVIRLDYVVENDVSIHVISHSHNQNVGSNSITLKGRISNPEAIVKVNNKIANKVGKTFEVDLPISKGKNQIIVTAEYNNKVVQYPLNLFGKNYTARFTNLVDREKLYTSLPQLELRVEAPFKRARVNNGDWEINWDSYQESNNGDSNLLLRIVNGRKLREGRNTITAEIEYEDGTIEKLTTVVLFDRKTLNFKILDKDKVSLTLTLPDDVLNKMNIIEFNPTLPRMRSRLFQAPSIKNSSHNDGAYGRMMDGAIIEDLGLDELSRRTVIVEFSYEIFQEMVKENDTNKVTGIISIYDSKNNVIFNQSLDYVVKYEEINREPKIFLWNYYPGQKIRTYQTKLIASVVNFKPHKATLNGRPIKVEQLEIANGSNDYFLSRTSLHLYQTDYELIIYDEFDNFITKKISFDYEPFLYTLISGQDFNDYKEEPIIALFEKNIIKGSENVSKDLDKVNMKSRYQMTDSQSNHHGIYTGNISFNLWSKNGGATAGSEMVSRPIDFPDDYNRRDRRNYLAYIDVLKNNNIAPEIDLLSPLNGSTTYHQEVMLEIITSNDQFSDVYVNGELAKKQILEDSVAVSPYKMTHQYRMPLKIGSNKIVVRAKSSLNEHVSEKVFTINRAEMPRPSFVINTPKNNEKFSVYNDDIRYVNIWGTYDTSIPIDELLVNGEKVSLSSSDINFSKGFSVGSHQLVITAKNSAGITEKIINFSVELTAPKIILQQPVSQVTTHSEYLLGFEVDDGNAYVTVNGLIMDSSDFGHFSKFIELNEGLNTFEIIAKNAFGEDKKTVYILKTTPSEVQSQIEVKSNNYNNNSLNIIVPSISIPSNLRYSTYMPERLVDGMWLGIVSARRGGPSNPLILDYEVHVDENVPSGKYVIPLDVTLYDGNGEPFYQGLYEIIVFVNTSPLKITFSNLLQDMKIPSLNYNVEGFVNDPKVQLEINSEPVLVNSNGHFSHILNLINGYNQIIVRAENLDQSYETTYQVNVLTNGLELAIVSPSMGETLNESSVKLSGIVSDPLASVSVNDLKVLVDDKGKFETQLFLAEGNQQILLNANNGYSTTSKTLNVKVLKQSLDFNINYPLEHYTFDQNLIRVTGVVSKSDAEVSVNGYIATVKPTGEFSVEFELPIGVHNLTILATSGSEQIQKTRTIHISDLANRKIIKLVRGNESELETAIVEVTSEEMALLKSYTYHMSNLPEGVSFEMTNVFCNGTNGAFEFKFISENNVPVNMHEATLTIVLKGGNGDVITTKQIPLLISVYDDKPTPLILEISSPNNEQIITSNNISINGKVNEANARVRIQGKNVSLNSMGEFTHHMSLAEGMHNILVTAEYSGQLQSRILTIIIPNISEIKLNKWRKATSQIDIKVSRDLSGKIRDASLEFDMPDGLDIDYYDFEEIDDMTYRIHLDITASNNFKDADFNMKVILKDQSLNAVSEQNLIIKVFSDI